MVQLEQERVVRELWQRLEWVGDVLVGEWGCLEADWEPSVEDRWDGSPRESHSQRTGCSCPEVLRLEGQLACYGIGPGPVMIEAAVVVHTV